MKIGMFCLVLGYVLSQFYRAFLAVLAPVLKLDLGANPAQLSMASGVWFLVFALMQLPVGAALDRIGPRRTDSVLLAIGGGGGAVLFALAQSPLHITLAMGLIGVGCSPMLMSAYYIFAKNYPPALFATLAGVMLGLGTIGNVASSLPLAWAVGLFGWRPTVLMIAGATFLVSILLYLFMRDPVPDTSADHLGGSVLDVLKLPVLWPIMAMILVNYAAAASIRSLWIGPYLDDVFALTPETAGLVILLMGSAMILGNFVYGPLDRLIPSKKAIVLGGNLLGAGSCFVLYVFADHSILVSAALLSAIGLFGASYAVIIAHARHFIPPHLIGWGVALLNLFGIGGAGIVQSVSGGLHTSIARGAATSAEPYQALFLFFGIVLLCGALVYAFSTDAK